MNLHKKQIMIYASGNFLRRHLTRKEKLSIKILVYRYLQNLVGGISLSLIDV